MLGGLGTLAHVFLALCECIWNAPMILLVLPTFGNAGSLGSPPCQVVYPPGSMFPPWMTVSHFLVVNRKAELKPITFSSLLLFVFSCTCVILVLRECIWNVSMVSLVLPAFNNTGSLGSLPHQVVYLPG